MATADPNNYLAEELIFNILSWLPVASLLRFRSVCMLWLSIISSPLFVETHKLNSKKKLPSILKCKYNNQVSMHMDYVHSSTHNDVYIDNLHDDCVNLKIKSLTLDFSGTNRLLGSYNGLVCVGNTSFRGETLYIWNPSTKLFKILPTPKKISNRSQLVGIGFGFDSTSDDYKILGIGDGGYSSGLVAELYSANADSWKEIEVPETLKYYWITPTSQSGVLYYRDANEVVSFNLHNELFKVYPYPCSQDKIKSDVLDFEGSVAMALQSCHDRSISLWTLDDVCGNVSWTKKFNLEADFKINWVILYLGIGQFVVEDNDKLWEPVEYILYDHKSKEKKPNILVSGVASIVKYTESLVSLKGFVQQKY